jgi:glucose/arabinose dehydrogenase
LRTRPSLPAPGAPIALAALVALGLGALPARAVVLPAGFTSDNVVPDTPFAVPTTLAFLPGGRMLVAEKAGKVWAVLNGTRSPTPLWRGEAEVLNESDRGLLGLAVDPAYVTNHFIYLFYTVDPDSDGVDNNDDAFGRLTRYTVSFTDSNTVDYTSRKVLLGATWPEGPVSDSPSHTEGDLQWGADGSLFVSAGDGAGYTNADAGGHDPDLFGPGRARPVEDIGAFRAQWIGSLAGKILRINPSTGEGYPDNPFWNGDPRSVQSRVWCYGLRNPFRFTVRPGTGSPLPSDHRPGTLFLGDVGWNTWEEQNIAREGGHNFGWPCWEGPIPRPEYAASHPIHHSCDSLGLGDNTGVLTQSTMYYPHTASTPSVPPGMIGGTAIGGVFYRGHIYPSEYRNRYFFCDFLAGWIRVATVDENDHVVSASDFAQSAAGPVDLDVDPVTGDLYYVAINIGQIRRIRWTGPNAGNAPPVAVANATAAAGVAPLRVAFSSAGSNDPDLDPLTLSWTFGDGVGSSLPNSSHTYLNGGTFAAILTADDHLGGIARDTVWVTVLGGASPFPSTALLDDFNRPDGLLGGVWTGEIKGAVVRGEAATGSCCDLRAVWSAADFPADQEAWCTISALRSVSEGLLLKVQGNAGQAGAVEVRYEAPPGRVTVATYDPAQGLLERASFPVPFAEGDRLGARAWSNGSVELYRNASLVGRCSIGDWPGAPLPGRIGFTQQAILPQRIDDFGGGPIGLDTAPIAAIVLPADSSFCVEGGTLALIGRGRDAEQSSASLVYDWRVDLHHGSHVHPASYVVQGPSATYVVPDHADANGIWYEIVLRVTDTTGLADTTRVAVFPEVDLAPGPVTINPPTPDTTTPAEYRFTIHNGGRMLAPTSRWRLVAGSVLLAEGDATIPPLDSLPVSILVPPSLAEGEHTLRLVVDTLGAVVETREDNNATTRPLIMHAGNGRGVLPAKSLPRELAVSHAYPSPVRGTASLALALPRAAEVEFSVHDLQGRRIWGQALREYPPGEPVLTWEGRLDAGGEAPPGIYLARVKVEGRMFVRPISRLR